MRNAWYLFLTCLISVSVLGATPVPGGSEDPKAAGTSSGQRYGKELTDAKLVPVQDVFEHPESYQGKTIKLEGTILEVCQKQGCWLTLGSGDKHLMVDMSDHTFFVPKDSSGRHVVVEGFLVLEPMSKEEIEHRASEGAETLKKGDKHLSPKLSFDAKGVVISSK
jgi:hypothetical protein